MSFRRSVFRRFKGASNSIVARSCCAGFGAGCALLLGCSPLRAADAVTNLVRPVEPKPLANQTNPAVEQELAKLEAADDAALAEVEAWTQQHNALKARGAAESDAELQQKIRGRLEPIRRAYEQFLSEHPTNARAHLVYGSFLNESQDEAGARAHWEKALELDPASAAAYNNLAGCYGESGPIAKAFEYFAKAIELSPAEALYYHNFADTVYVQHKSAMAHYGLTEQQTYAKALLLYSNAARLAPTNFTFAADLADTFYALKPLPVEPALSAWTNALQRALRETEREAVLVHLSRVKMLAGRLTEARAQLIGVTNDAAAQLKANLLRAIEEREKSETRAPKTEENPKPRNPN